MLGVNVLVIKKCTSFINFEINRVFFFMQGRAFPQDSASWGKQLIIFNHYRKQKSGWHKMCMMDPCFPVLTKHQWDEIIAVQLVIPL